ncbi:hypothetical protein ACQP1W_17230 [Spirillospora sp. CA-255316]
MIRDTRTLPALAAGPVEMPFAILNWSEVFARAHPRSPTPSGAIQATSGRWPTGRPARV